MTVLPESGARLADPHLGVRFEPTEPLPPDRVTPVSVEFIMRDARAFASAAWIVFREADRPDPIDYDKYAPTSGPRVSALAVGPLVVVFDLTVGRGHDQRELAAFLYLVEHVWDVPVEVHAGGTVDQTDIEALDLDSRLLEALRVVDRDGRYEMRHRGTREHVRAVRALAADGTLSAGDVGD